MFLVYIGGPYRAETGEKILANIEAAKARALEVYRRLGPDVYPVVPHLMGLWDPLAYDCVGENQGYHLKGLIKIMRRCDAVLFPEYSIGRLTPGQEEEFREAQRFEIPCFETVKGLANWVREQLRMEQLTFRDQVYWIRAPQN